MIAIAFRFLAGRFHATPWGRHVNEGIAEWPPSPFRIIRALVALWRLRCPEIPQDRGVRALQGLVGSPVYHLPAASAGHTRHFMPWDKAFSSRDWNAARTKIFDNFIAVDPAEDVVVYWPNATLDEQASRDLAAILSTLSYLGRAESWCDARLVAPAADWEDTVNAQPHDPDRDDGEPVRVLTADSELSLDGLDEDHPICVRTPRVRASGLLQPGASVWRSYGLPRSLVEPKIGTATPRPRRSPPQVFRFRIDSSPLPRLTDALDIGDAVRRAAMGRYGGGDRRRSSILSGHSPNGRRHGHDHCYFLPLDIDRDGRLEEVVLLARSGFDELHLAAFDRLRRVQWRRDREPLRFIPLGAAATADDLDGLAAIGPSPVWTSTTPFLLTRHPKLYTSGPRKGSWMPTELPQGITLRVPDDLGRYSSGEHLLFDYGYDSAGRVLQRSGPIDQLLCSIRQLSEAWNVQLPVVEVTPIPRLRWSGMTVRWTSFRRFRRRNKPTSGIGYGFRIVFDRPVRGPLMLGYAAHQGLGRFDSVPTEGPSSDGSRT